MADQQQAILWLEPERHGHPGGDWEPFEREFRRLVNPAAAISCKMNHARYSMRYDPGAGRKAFLSRFWEAPDCVVIAVDGIENGNGILLARFAEEQQLVGIRRVIASCKILPESTVAHGCLIASTPEKAVHMALKELAVRNRRLQEALTAMAIR